MSKIVKLLNAHPTNKVFADLKPLASITSIDEEYQSISYGIQYKIKVTIGAQVIVTDNQKENLDLAVRDVKHQVAEEVFGEFRHTLNLIKDAIWNREFEKARHLVYKLEEDMFSND